MGNELANTLFEAVDLITAKRLGDLEFDKTLLCTIEDNSNAQKGEYRVTDGASSFLAYSENTKYALNEKVYVNVPNGDMGNQKIITGKYINEGSEYVTYVSPMDNFVNVTNNLINQNYEISLLANNDECRFKVIWEDLECSYKGYERLGISANFRTWLNSKALQGSYGLRLDVVEKTEAKATKFHSFYLDTSDMYGNPYNYNSYFLQEKLFNVKNIHEICAIRLSFYQNSDFINLDGETIPYKDKNNNFIPDNLFVQDPYIALGYDVNSFTEDTVLLGTHDSLTYNKDMTPKNRAVYMRWVHENEGKFYSIDEKSEVPENTVIHWYRYKLEQRRQDALAGFFWEEIDPGKDLFNYNFIPDYNISDDMLKVIIEYPSREYVAETLTANKDIATNLKSIYDSGLLGNEQYNNLERVVRDMMKSNDIDAINEKYKYLIFLYTQLENEDYLSNILSIILEAKAETKYYTSEVLHFTNEITQVDELLDLVQSLTLEVDTEGFNGIYRIYDEANNIVNSTESNKMRILRAKYSSVITGEESLDQAEEIIWYFPIENTMIHPPIEGKEYNTGLGDIYIEDCGLPGYVAIKRLGTEIAGDTEEGMQLIETEQLFRIKDYYTQTACNNEIICKVRKRQKDYETSAALVFGSTGSNGTEATFRLKMYEVSGNNIVDEISAITAGGRIAVVPELYDYNNKLIDISDSTISYSWYSKNKSNAISLDGSSAKGNIPLGITSNSTNIENNKYYILQATIDWQRSISIDEQGNTENKTIKLNAYLPIAVRINNTYREIEGSTRVVYNSYGINPSYYKDPFKIYAAGSLTPLNATWTATSPDFNSDNDIARRYYPSLTSSGEFVPVKMYYTGLNSFAVNAIINGATVWSQPILIIQNRYSSPMLNGWNGDLIINEKNGTILSAMMGAGIKNNDNSFSGILLGEIGKAIEEEGIGLYGFDHGVQSYGFNIDGTAFIGESGKGRIEFDGNKGTITSGNYSRGKTGMQIDLDDPYMYAYGAGGAFEMDLSDADSSMLRIKSADEKILLNIESGKYFMQSEDYSPSFLGTHFDLTNGKLFAYNSFGGDFELDTTKPNNLLVIRDNYNNTLVNIGNSNYFLQSSNYGSDMGTRMGTRFDLGKGQLFAYNDGDSFEMDTQNSNALLTIKSSSKTLLNVGSGEYYMQSKDYDGTKGTHFNLKEGQLLAYGSSSSFELKTNEAENFLIIKEQSGVTLISIGKDQYYLQSVNYQEGTSGAKINLGEGKFEFYSNSENNQKDSNIMISSQGDPYFQVTHTNVELIKISIDTFILQSQNWNSDSKTGMSFNVLEGYIEGYNGSQEWVKMNWGNAEIDPININDVFKVNWKGEIESTAGKIGSWYIDENGLYSYNPEEGNSNGGIALTPNETLCITAGNSGGDTYFSVSSDGTITCKGATIEKATITGECTIKGILNGGEINGSKIISNEIYCDGLYVNEVKYIMHEAEIINSYYGAKSNATVVTSISSIKFNDVGYTLNGTIETGYNLTTYPVERTIPVPASTAYLSTLMSKRSSTTTLTYLGAEASTSVETEENS